jgi:hypothetical protein
MANNTGSGQFAFVDPAGQILWVSRVFGATFAEESTDETAQAYPSFDTGPLQDVDVISTERTVTLTIQIESIDTMDWSLILNRGLNTANITVPMFRSVTVPATGPYEVAVTGLTADQTVYATVAQSAAPGNLALTQIDVADVATIAPREFAVGADEITFDEAQAGATVGIFYDELLTAQEHFGGATANPLGNLRFIMAIRSTRQSTPLIFSFKEIRREGGISISAGTDPYELTYRALLPAGDAEVFTARFAPA